MSETPKPKNFDAMWRAYDSKDPVQIAREKAIYNAQLIEEGFAPLYEQPTMWNEADR